MPTAPAHLARLLKTAKAAWSPWPRLARLLCIHRCHRTSETEVSPSCRCRAAAEHRPVSTLMWAVLKDSAASSCCQRTTETEALRASVLPTTPQARASAEASRRISCKASLDDSGEFYKFIHSAKSWPKSWHAVWNQRVPVRIAQNGHLSNCCNHEADCGHFRRR